ncbi:glycosyltransferase [Metapseudomonas furukawaii]|uniref:glycosyltransferase n=1 Tax=Metapseudomonas furukawaii TaxID=1149133 RepID=UPI00227D264E|nr:glycosyltransferase [Pseudomonas furukawaii]WAG77618.1 glycosyltransferase [Pseudomonas furukawaii]
MQESVIGLAELPLVSVCIGSYKHVAYLRDCLDSVFQQIYPNLDVVVVDDASCDGTAELLEDYARRYPDRFRYEVFPTNSGVSKTFNQAFSLARSEYIATLGSDDRMHPRRVASQIALMLENPDCVACFTQVRVIDGEGRPHTRAQGLADHFNQPIHDLRWQLLDGNLFNGPSLMLRKSAFFEVGGYLGTLKYVQDYDLYLRLLEKGSLLRVDEPLTDYRVHDSNLSVSFRAPDPALGLEMLVAMLNALRIWPLESLFAENLDAPAARAAALLRVAEHLQRMDAKYQRRTSIGTAQAYQLAVQAARLDPERAGELKLRLERELKTLPVADRVLELSPEQQAALWRLSSGQQQAYLAKLVDGAMPGFTFVLFADGASRLALAESLASCFLYYPLCERILVVSRERPKGLMAAVEWIESTGFLAAPVEALAPVTGWVLFLWAGDRLDPSGFLRAADAIQDNPQWRSCYFDEDSATTGALYRPDFNLDLLRSYPYMGRALAFEAGAMRQALQPGGAFSVYEWIFRFYERFGASAIGHAAEVAVQTAEPFADWLVNSAQALAFPLALQRHLERSGIAHQLLPRAEAGLQRVRYLHEQSASVSIIIHGKGDLASLQLCLESLIEHTTREFFEIIVIDAFGDDRAQAYLVQLAEIAAGRIVVASCAVDDAEPAVLNQAVAIARGDHLLFLDQRVVPLGSDWLANLLNHGQRQEVGAVGARLCYPDGRTYHGGLVLGLNGIAGRAFHGAPVDHPGYMYRLQVDHDLSAVDCACLLVRRDDFLGLQGFEQGQGVPGLSLELLAIDLCQRLVADGKLVVFAADAILMYRDDERTAPAPPTDAEAEAAQQAFYKRWLPSVADDPAYNRHFARHGAGFEQEVSPRLATRFLPAASRARLLCLPGDLQGSGHYRVIQPCQHLVEAALMDGQCEDRFLNPVELQRYKPDVVVLQRQVGEAQRQAMEDIARFSDAYRLYDLDDYLFDLPAKNAHRQHLPKDLIGSLAKAFSLVDGLVVSTDALADALSDRHHNIRVVNNYLPPAWWQGLRPSRQAGRKPRVGWAGGISHTGDLEMMAEVVRELASEVEWVFLGMCPDVLRPFVQEFHAGVAIDQYPAKLASLNLDLALAPLEQNLFNQCKSNLRLLEYGACGYPVICTDIHPYRGALPVIRVANRKHDWLDAIRAQLADLDKAAADGERLRQAVLKDWMLAGDNLVRWQQAWRSGN